MALILINYGITCKGISAGGYICHFLISSYISTTTHLLALGGIVHWGEGSGGGAAVYSVVEVFIRDIRGSDINYISVT